MRLLSIDPGKRCLGWALWGSSLEACGIVRTKVDDLGLGAQELVGRLPTGAELVVVELPRIYPYERRINVNDLIDLAAVAGACAAVGPVQFVWPATWKGQVPKDISHQRIQKALTATERDVVERDLAQVPKSLRHNVLDAIGIGQWRRGRRDGHV